MSAAHSSAPWWVTDGGVRNSGGYIVHTNSVQHYDGQDERYVREVAEREADKRLIAAAPDMFDVLETIVRVADGRRISGNLILDENSPLMGAARDALSKARGSAP